MFYTIASAICKIKKGKQFVHTFGDFVLSKGRSIYSVNLDRENTFLTLSLCQPFYKVVPKLWVVDRYRLVEKLTLYLGCS